MPRPFVPHSPLPTEFLFEQDSLSNIWMYMSVQPPTRDDALVLPVEECFKSLSLEIGASDSAIAGEIAFFIPVDPQVSYKSQNGFLTVNSYTLVDELKTISFPRLYIQWGWLKQGSAIGTTGGAYPENGLATRGSLPMMLCNLANIRCDFNEHGTHFTAGLLPFYSAALSTARNIPPREWANTRVDKIITDILTAYGIPQSDWFIDGCPTVIDAIRMTADQSPIDFINQTLLPKITDSRGQEYTFWVDVFNRVHFVRQALGVREAYVPPSGDSKLSEYVTTTTRVVRKQFLYKADQKGLVIDFAPEDNRVASLFAGADVTQYTYTPGGSGEPTTAEAHPATGVNGRGVGVYTPGSEARVTPVVHEDGDDTIHSANAKQVYGSSSGEADARVANAHASERAGYYKANMETLGIAYLAVLDFIQVDAIDRWGFLLPQSGVYQIFKLTHNVSPGRWTTTYQLQRQGDVLGTLGVLGTAATMSQSPHSVDSGGVGGNGE